MGKCPLLAIGWGETVILVGVRSIEEEENNAVRILAKYQAHHRIEYLS